MKEHSFSHARREHAALVNGEQDEQVTTWAVAIIGGLLVGGFLFFRLHHLIEREVTGRKPALPWYTAATFLAALGLGGTFPRRNLAATLGMILSMAVGASLGAFFELSGQPTNRNQLGPVPVIMWFFVGFGGPFGEASSSTSSRSAPEFPGSCISDY